MVPEPDTVEPDVAAQRALERLRMAGLAQARLGLEHLRDPRACRQGLLHRRHALAKHAQRPDEHDHIGAERHERPRREVTRDRLPPAEPEDGADADEGQHLEQRVEDGVQAREVEGPVDDLVAARSEAPG